MACTEMSNRCGFSAFQLLVAAAIVFSTMSGELSAAPASNAQKRLSLQESYRRIEVVVTSDFQGECENRESVGICTFSRAAPFIAQIAARLEKHPRIISRLSLPRRELRLLFSDPQLQVQSRRLEGPPRWIVEVGYPEVLIGPIEDELPFRPYPLPSRTVHLDLDKRLPMRVSTLPDRDDDARRYNKCFAAWQREQFQQVLTLCQPIVRELNPASQVSKAARRLIGEAWYRLTETELEWSLEQALLSLKAAEESAQNEEQARYVLLAAQVCLRKGDRNRAELVLDNALSRQRGNAALYIRAEQIRILLEAGDQQGAREALMQMSSSSLGEGGVEDHNPVRANILISNGALAYEKRDYASAMSFFERAAETWPHELSKEPYPKMMWAELLYRAGRLIDARDQYLEFLRNFDGKRPSWIAKLRLLQIKAFERPKAAYNEIAELKFTEPEGEQLARLYMMNLRDIDDPLRSDNPRTVLRELGGQNLDDYPLIEWLLQSSRLELSADNLNESFALAQRIWEQFPKHPVLVESQLFFDRLLVMTADQHLREEKDQELISLYYNERPRFRSNRQRGLLLLMVARSMRKLNMLEEAARLLPQTTGDLSDGTRARAEALVELLGVYRELALQPDPSAADITKFTETLSALDRDYPTGIQRFPTVFDSFDYWMSKGYKAEIDQDLNRAKEIYLYALNGPRISPADRIRLAQRIISVYLKLPDYDAALNALRVLLQIQSEYAAQVNMPTLRQEILWRIVELHLQLEQWPQSVGALRRFIDEFPNHPYRHEALFFIGKSLLNMGDVRGAKRRWDLLYKEAPSNTYGRLAELELQMLSWQREISPRLQERLQR
ncbi:MAG: tetratricopeptide repeat protein [Myxococcota bacterium]|nr:tetratricopeptide repeat protein [Myxococcota bacterium]